MEINNQIIDKQNDIENQEKNKEINNRKPSLNDDLKNNLLINNISEYKLNLFSLITKVCSNKNMSSKKIENEFILNLILMSSKLNKSNKLICLLLLFYLNQNDKKHLNFLTYLFSKISEISTKIENIPNVEDYISLKDSTFLINETNLLYSKKNIFNIKQMIANKNCDLNYITTIENLLKDINKNFKSYLQERRNEFLNRNIMDDNHLNQLKNIIYQLFENKVEIPEKSPIFLINKKWVFRTKLFLDTYCEARKENIEKLLLEESFLVDKVYDYFMGKADNSKLKNYYGIVFPGPINNYELLDLRDIWLDPINLGENIIIKDNLTFNEDYLYLGENDWNYIKDIFGATNEIGRINKEQSFYKNKIIIFESRLRSKDNKHLLKKKIIQINSELTVKDFKNKIIRCFNYELNNNYNNNEIYQENDVKFFYVDKRNKDILIEMCISFVNQSKFYGSLYTQNVKSNDEDLIKDIFNIYDSKYYFLIAEIFPKENPRYFIQKIEPDINNSNIYNCSICGEQLNLIEKYNCDLCNFSLFCSNECANVSGEHQILHKFLNELYNKKFNINKFLEEKIKSNKESLNGIIGLSKDKNSSCINSIIQCLSNNKDFTKYFLNDIYTNDINISDFITIKNTFINKYNNLIREMWLGRKNNKNNKNLEICHKEFIQLLVKRFKLDINDNASMNNIHEILISILDRFHKELNRYLNIEKIKEKIGEDNIDNGIKRQIKKDSSIIADLFQGIYQSILSCSKCGNVSLIYDFFRYILLPLPKKNNNLFIKYFNEFECKNMRYVMEDTSTIRSLKDKAIHNVSDKINHIINIMSLTELIDVTAFDNEDEKVLTYTAMYNSIELVQFDKNKILTKVYVTDIKPDSDNKVKKNENNDFNLQLSKIYKENNDAELVFYERSVVDKDCINIYVYPFMYNDKEKFNKNKDKLFNVYPIAISAKPTLIIGNLVYLINVRIRDLLLEHFKEESERREINYIELVYPHFFYNCSYHSQANCFLCKERKKNSLFCPLLSAIDKDASVQDLMNLFEYPKQPIFFLAKCKYYDLKKRFYKNMESFPSEISNKKNVENKLDIYDCFELYTKKETIEEMDWFCESCNSFQIPQKQLLIYKPPLYLIIQFDRYQAKKSPTIWNNYCFDDILISFPINNLDIGEYVEGPEKNKAIYNLYGVICREVSARSDYIYSACKNNKKWFMFKDIKVLGINALVNKNAHFLFYKRQDLND